MIEKITRPLQQKDGIEAFRNNIIEIEYRLRNGLLQNPWEVEVALLSIGRVSIEACFYAFTDGG